MTTMVFAFNDKNGAGILLEQGVTNLLVSYYYLRSYKPEKLQSFFEFVKSNRKGEGVFILDSGAFSAWNNGNPVSLYAYIDFIKEHHHHFTHIVCLDVINDPIYSEVNHLIMRKELEGLPLVIIPIFHSGESFTVLDYMVEKGYKYLGISPNNDWREEQKRAWLYRVFTRHDFDALGIKTHAFGYQSTEGLSYFPLTTADAVTWRIASGYGRIIDPVNPSVRYSEKAAGYYDHIDNIPGGDSQFTIDLCNELGFPPDDLKTDYRKRNIFNIHALDKLSKAPKKILSTPVELFSEGDVGGFSEEEVQEVYRDCLSQGRNYSGSPSSIPLSVKSRRFKKVEKEVMF